MSKTAAVTINATLSEADIRRSLRWQRLKYRIPLAEQPDDEKARADKAQGKDSTPPAFYKCFVAVGDGVDQRPVRNQHRAENKSDDL